MRILILTGKFGMGHYSTAATLEQRIIAADPGTQVIIEDIFEYAMPEYSQAVYKAFGFMVTKGSVFYNCYYNKTMEKGPDMKPAFLSYFIKKLELLMDRMKPDAVWSTLPFCSQVVSWYKEKTKSSIPLVTCITDISTHSEWMNRHTDCYLVPTVSVRCSLIKRGVSVDSIFICGIPVRPEFDVEKRSHSGRRKKLLLMGGGLGLLPSSQNFYEELDRMNRYDITLIAGENHAVYEKYYGRYENIRVIGFTDKVYCYMAEADAVISKPGGITLFETIYSETPLLALEPYLQQEINNAGFITSHGIGLILKREPEACLTELVRIMEDDLLLYAIRSNMKRLKCKYGCDAFQAVLEKNGIIQKKVAVS